jgi:hypothetical protein
MRLQEARAVVEKLKTSVQQNQGDKRMQKHAMEELVRDIEAMTVSAWTSCADMHDYFLPSRTTEGVSSPAGAEVD